MKSKVAHKRVRSPSALSLYDTISIILFHINAAINGVGERI